MTIISWHQTHRLPAAAALLFIVQQDDEQTSDNFICICICFLCLLYFTVYVRGFFFSSVFNLQAIWPLQICMYFSLFRVRSLPLVFDLKTIIMASFTVFHRLFHAFSIKATSFLQSIVQTYLGQTHPPQFYCFYIVWLSSVTLAPLPQSLPPSLYLLTAHTPIHTQPSLPPEDGWSVGGRLVTSMCARLQQVRTCNTLPAVVWLPCLDIPRHPMSSIWYTPPQAPSGMMNILS